MASEHPALNVDSPRRISGFAVFLMGSVLLILLLLIGIFVFRPHAAADLRVATDSHNESTAFKVAALDANAAPTDRQVAAIQSALDGLAGVCTGSETENADAAQAASRFLADNGIVASRLAILIAARDSVPPNAHDVLPCDEVVSAWVALQVASHQ